MSDSFLVVYSLLRTAFVPFFIACNVNGSSQPPIITSDIVYMLGLFLLGVTCGHGTTLALIATSKREAGREAQVTQFWMMAGVVAGGVASFGVLAVL